jgi:tripeptidyl-peptidase I
MAAAARTWLVAALLALAQQPRAQAAALRVAAPAYALTGWAQDAATVEADTAIELTLVLNGQRHSELRRAAREVSDPASPRYGQYLSQREVDELTAPRPEHVAAVHAWLSAAPGVTFTVVSSTDIAVAASAGAASALLRTSFHAVTRVDGSGPTLVRAADYELPDVVRPAVSTVFGLHGLPLPGRAVGPAAGPKRRRLQPPPVPGPPAANITPAIVREAYGATHAHGGNHTRQAVVEFQNQQMNDTDLVDFFNRFVESDLFTPGVDDTVSKFVGLHAENSQGLEAALDVQYLMGVAPKVPTEFWEFPAPDFGADMNFWTTQLLATKEDPPLVWSVSYGFQGNLSSVHILDQDVAAVDLNLAKLAARG